MAWTGRRPTRARTAIAGSGDVDWDREWQRVWKPHPDNAWFLYQADVYAAWLEAAGEDPTALVLKTDAFDEACGFDPLVLARDGHAGIVHVDISARIARLAARHADLAPHACASVVRLLGF